MKCNCLLCKKPLNQKPNQNRLGICINCYLKSKALNSFYWHTEKYNPSDLLNFYKKLNKLRKLQTML